MMTKGVTVADTEPPGVPAEGAPVAPTDSDGLALYEEGVAAAIEDSERSRCSRTRNSCSSIAAGDDYALGYLAGLAAVEDGEGV